MWCRREIAEPVNAHPCQPFGDVYGINMQYPLSQDEHAAMARYLAGIKKQLQDACDLFSTRYGKSSNLAELAVKTLAAATLLEHELTVVDNGREEFLNDSVGTTTPASLF